MRRPRMGRATLAALAGLGTTLFQGCPGAGLATGLLNDCIGEGTISEREYDDLNSFEQAFYERNDCGRYEPTSGLAEDILELF